MLHYILPMKARERRPEIRISKPKKSDIRIEYGEEKVGSEWSDDMNNREEGEESMEVVQ